MDLEPAASPRVSGTRLADLVPGKILKSDHRKLGNRGSVITP